MEIVFSEQAWEDFQYWIKTDRKTLARIIRLIEAIDRDPYAGIGKPEPLKHALSGTWSRRIDEVHRIVYEVSEDQLRLAQLRYHY